ncbi:MAG: hypothetical protein M1825_006519 [Sarcosagium campestre]|nr:MAG: hypothetical protein M1825_006519 [Sarcosagium campestre]
MYNTDVGVSITADKNYVPGEEIYLCYGKLNNDFLMIDYGFTLDDNRYDTVWLNTVVLDHTTVGDKWRLVDKFLHGRYVLDREAVCYRTYATVRLLVEDYENWKEWVDGTRDDTELMNPEVHEKLVDILRLQLTRGAQKRKKLKLAARTEPEAAACVDRRWQQTVDMLKEAIIKYSPGGHVVAYPKPIPKKFDFGPQLDLVSLEGQANPKAMMPRRR